MPPNSACYDLAAAHRSQGGESEVVEEAKRRLRQFSVVMTLENIAQDMAVQMRGMFGWKFGPSHVCLESPMGCGARGGAEMSEEMRELVTGDNRGDLELWQLGRQIADRKRRDVCARMLEIRECVWGTGEGAR